MGKINICSVLENVTENKFFCNETVGIINDNKIKYVDKLVTVVITIESDELTIVRRSKEYEIVLPLKENETLDGIYNIQSLGSLELNVHTIKLVIEDNLIEVEYEMIMDKENKTKFKFKLEYGE